MMKRHGLSYLDRTEIRRLCGPGWPVWAQGAAGPGREHAFPIQEGAVLRLDQGRVACRNGGNVPKTMIRCLFVDGIKSTSTPQVVEINGSDTDPYFRPATPEERAMVEPMFARFDGAHQISA